MMKRLLIILFLPLLLSSCKTGDLLTLYSEQTYTESIGSTAPETTEITEDTGNIVLESMTNEVTAGDIATVTVKGEAGKEYSISVFYGSGISEASGLENKVADGSGRVSWSWRVGARTKSGSYKIEIRAVDALLTLYFTVV